MSGSAVKRAETLRKLSFNEEGWPVGDLVTDVEIHVMDLDVSKVMGDDLAHRPGAGCHLSQFVPQSVIERAPRLLEKLERSFEVGTQFGRRSASAKIRGRVGVVVAGLEPTDFSGRRPSEQQGVGRRLVCEVRDDVSARKPGEQARRAEVGI
jgi:hypothetical protein